MRSRTRWLLSWNNPASLRFTLTSQKTIGTPGHGSCRIRSIILTARLFGCDAGIDFSSGRVGDPGSTSDITATQGPGEDLSCARLGRGIGDLKTFVIVLVFLVSGTDLASILLCSFR